MGRALATVLAVAALVFAVALLDHGRDAGTAELARTAEPADASTPVASPATPAFGAPALARCLADVAAEPPAAGAKFPGLDDDGVAAISRRVERIRELRFDGPVDAAFLGPEQLDRRIRRLVDRDYSRALAGRQGATLELLGAIPPGSDLYALTTDTLAAQVIGLYVPETKELLIAKSGSAGAIEEITLAHELEHALAADALGFPLPDRTRAGRGDRDLAVQSLIEGDATLTMEAYAQRYVGLSDQLGAATDPAVADGGLDELPDFLRRNLIFPYEAGLKYVCERFEQGGWKAVDRAYRNPPQSTSELVGLNPDLDEPAVPLPTAELPDGWRATLRDQLGAAELAWLFAAPGGEVGRGLPEPSNAIAGWAGGRLTLWERGDASGESALAISLVDRGTGSLCGAMIAWYAAAFPDSELGRSGATTTFEEAGRSAALTCSGESIRMGIGPGPAVADRLGS